MLRIFWAFAPSRLLAEIFRRPIMHWMTTRLRLIVQHERKSLAFVFADGGELHGQSGSYDDRWAAGAFDGHTFGGFEASLASQGVEGLRARMIVDGRFHAGSEDGFHVRGRVTVSGWKGQRTDGGNMFSSRWGLPRLGFDGQQPILAERVGDDAVKTFRRVGGFLSGISVEVPEGLRLGERADGLIGEYPASQLAGSLRHGFALHHRLRLGRSLLAPASRRGQEEGRYQEGTEGLERSHGHLCFCCFR